MEALYEEPKSLGSKLIVYGNRIVYKAGFLNPEQTILMKNIVSVSVSPIMPQVILETAGSQKFSIITKDKEKVKDIILNAIG